MNMAWESRWRIWQVGRAAATTENLGQVVTDAGFTRFRRAAETPFNLVYEARR